MTAIQWNRGPLADYSNRAIFLLLYPEKHEHE